MKILVIEDNPAEARLTREAFAESGVPHVIRVVGDGMEATACLNREGIYRDEAMPDLILLDLNLPRKDGREVLREIKSNPDLSSIPVIVVTNSHAQEDVDQVYRLRANCYLVKPPGIDEFFAMVRRVIEFWWQTARLPNGNRDRQFVNLLQGPAQ